MAYKQKKRKIKKKFLLILIAIFVILLICIIVSLIGPSGDKIVYNKNESFIKTQKVKGIVFKDIECTYDGKDSLISYTMVNDTDKKIYLNKYDVIVKDKDNIRLTKIAPSVNQTLAPKKALKMANQVVGIDLSKAHYMELKLNTDKKKK